MKAEDIEKIEAGRQSGEQINQHSVRQEFSLKSADEPSQHLVLSIDYDTFLALGFDGYDGEDLRAFIRQSIEQGLITIRHANITAEIDAELAQLSAQVYKP